VKRIFALMQANYGTRWKDQTGTGDALKLSMKVWSEKLADLTDEQIIHGLSNLPGEFPPTPAKFKSLCKGFREDWEHNTAAYKPFDKSRAIEKKPNMEIKSKAMNEIRGMIA
jgi:hypothetical protein